MGGRATVLGWSGSCPGLFHERVLYSCRRPPCLGASCTFFLPAFRYSASRFVPLFGSVFAAHRRAGGRCSAVYASLCHVAQGALHSGGQILIYGPEKLGLYDCGARAPSRRGSVTDLCSKRNRPVTLGRYALVGSES